MSVVKSKRSQSKVEFEMIYFRLADGIDTLVENDFIDHNACYKSIKSMDALYRKLFPPHVDPPKQGRREIAILINRNAEPEDLVTLYNIKRKDYE